MKTKIILLNIIIHKSLHQLVAKIKRDECVFYFVSLGYDQFRDKADVGVTAYLDVKKHIFT